MKHKNYYTKIQRITIFCLLLFVFHNAFSQVDTLDVNINEFSSDNVILKDSKKHLFEVLGDPDINRKYELLICDTVYSIGGCHSYLKKYICSSIFFYKKKGLEYFCIGDSVSLASINFSKQKGAKIYFRDFVLDSNFVMENIINRYSLKKDVDYIDEPFMPFEQDSEGKNIFSYEISFFSDYFRLDSFHFGFYNNKKRALQYIMFPYNYYNSGVKPAIKELKIKNSD